MNDITRRTVQPGLESANIGTLPELNPPVSLRYRIDRESNGSAINRRRIGLKVNEANPAKAGTHPIMLGADSVVNNSQGNNGRSALQRSGRRHSAHASRCADVAL